jgi:hypothetical protein
MTDLSVWQFCADPHCKHPTPHYFTAPQDGTPPDFEAMWEDCRKHRDKAEKRARFYMDLYRRFAEIVEWVEREADDPSEGSQP